MFMQRRSVLKPYRNRHTSAHDVVLLAESPTGGAAKGWCCSVFRYAEHHVDPVLWLSVGRHVSRHRTVLRRALVDTKASSCYKLVTISHAAFIHTLRCKMTPSRNKPLEQHAATKAGNAHICVKGRSPRPIPCRTQWRNSEATVGLRGMHPTRWCPAGSIIARMCDCIAQAVRMWHAAALVRTLPGCSAA
jgi:hypothetical protein